MELIDIGLEIKSNKKGLLGVVNAITKEVILPFKYSFIDNVFNVNNLIMVKDEEGKKFIIELLPEQE